MKTPLNRHQLALFLREQLGISVSSLPLIGGHRAPLDYLAHVFFQGKGGFGKFASEEALPLDCVVWASRGGGKTFLGAVATALDLVFKPGIEVRILGGSLDQSRRMHAHLKRLFAKDPLAELIEGRITEGRLALTNGSAVELLAQSHTAVRGTRVQTLRCDEAELFKDDVFDAAMLTTVSKMCDIPGVGPTRIKGSVECLSTLHVPFGIMSRIVKDTGARTVFKWGVVDVLEACGEERACASCALWEECGGRAKRDLANEQMAKRQREKGRGTRSAECGAGGKMADGEGSARAGMCPDLAVRARSAAREVATDLAMSSKDEERSPEQKQEQRASALSSDAAAGLCATSLAALRARTASERSAGHLSIDDAIAMKRRVSLAMWRTEMLCLEPSRADSVFPEFDQKVHVFSEWSGEEWFQRVESPLDWLDPLRTIPIPSLLHPKSRHPTFLCGIDFGFRAPTVILWAALEENGTLRILDERHVTGSTTKQHVEAILRGNGRYWRVPDWIGADPAGKQRQTQTGVSDVQVLASAGLDVKTRGSEIDAGLGLIRARLAPGDGPARLLVHERCARLVEALVSYHYKVGDPEDLRPVKDGSDHAIDALRYLVLNLDVVSGTRVTRYA
ncbi:MAG: hypothetical protein ACREJD_15415 [Phycisphaerales bacterium]